MSHRRPRFPIHFLVAVALWFGTVHPAAAQQDLADACAGAASVEAQGFCRIAAWSAQTLQARLGIANAAGNPVPGSPSTFGMRLGPIPRMSLDARFTVATLELPPIQRLSSGEEPDGLLTSFHVDASVGLFSGVALMPTVGGFGSLDLIGSVGWVNFPGDDGFDGDQPINWGVGARIGITRESFTAPGISLSAMYRNLAEVSFGDSAFNTADAFLHVDAHTAWNLRAVIGKRISVLGLLAGAGYDLHRADVLLAISNPGGSRIESREDDYGAERWTAFANASFTMVILSLNGELGWQSGGEGRAELGPGGDVLGNSGFYGSIALRLAI